jgi:hypothetical protein
MKIQKGLLTMVDQFLKYINDIIVPEHLHDLRSPSHQGAMEDGCG